MAKLKGSPKTGGRKKGTPNRLTQDVIARLQDLDFSPIDELVGMYREPSTPPNEKIAIARDIAQYVYPKRKAVEHSGTGAPLIIQIDGKDALL